MRVGCRFGTTVAPPRTVAGSCERDAPSPHRKGSETIETLPTSARRVRIAAGLVWFVGLAAITLTPGRAPFSGIVSFCVLCGERGAADAALNTVLFLPLGLLVGTRRGPLFALLVGLAVSGGVEGYQFLLAGRYSNMGDLVWNGFGTMLGAASVPWLRRWLLLGHVRAGRIVAVALPALWFLASGLLLHPLPSRGPYTVGGPWLIEADLADPDAAGSPWGVSGRAIRPPESYERQPLAVIRDGGGERVRVVGDDRGDLVLWERTWAPLFRFDYATHHLYGAFDATPVGDAVSFSASRSSPDGLCLRMEGREACGLGVTPARTWTLLRSREHASERLKARVDVAWVATLTLLLGLLGGGARGMLLSIGALAAFTLLVPAVTVLVMPGWPELLGAALGLGAGVAARPLARMFLGEGCPVPRGAEEARRATSPAGLFGLARGD